MSLFLRGYPWIYIQGFPEDTEYGPFFGGQWTRTIMNSIRLSIAKSDMRGVCYYSQPAQSTAVGSPALKRVMKITTNESECYWLLWSIIILRSTCTPYRNQMILFHFIKSSRGQWMASEIIFVCDPRDSPHPIFHARSVM